MRAGLRYMMLAAHRYHSWRLPSLSVVCFRAVAAHSQSSWHEVSRALAEYASAACQAKARWRDAARYLHAALRDAPEGEGGGAEGSEVAQEHTKLLQGLQAMLARAREVGQELSHDAELLALRVPRVATAGYSVHLNGLQVLCSLPAVAGDNCAVSIPLTAVLQLSSEKANNQKQPKITNRYCQAAEPHSQKCRRGVVCETRC